MASRAAMFLSCHSEERSRSSRGNEHRRGTCFFAFSWRYLNCAIFYFLSVIPNPFAAFSERCEGSAFRLCIFGVRRLDAALPRNPFFRGLSSRPSQARYLRSQEPVTR